MTTETLGQKHGRRGKDKRKCMEEYLAESIKRGRMVRSSYIPNIENINFSKNWVENNYGGINEFRLASCIYLANMSEEKILQFLYEYDLDRNDIRMLQSEF